MNLKERNMVYRVYKTLDAVPGAYTGGGTKSVSVLGVATFANDMTRVREHVNKALLVLCDGDPDLSKAERDEQFDAHLRRADEFIAMRKADDWR